MDLSSAFWKDRSVFVTGHTGFKGSWLVAWLHGRGARVSGFSLEPPSTPSLFEDARIATLMTRSDHGDVRDLDALTAALARARPDVVIHMAAQSLVRPSYEQPVETYATNVMGTVHLLEAVRRASTPEVVLVVTSDKCYENREWERGYAETDAFGGADPYSSSKGCAEIVTAAYRRSYFNGSDAPAIASVRAGNVIGGGDWARDRLVPDIVRAFLARDTAIIRNPAAVRPWQHVLEPLYGYLALAERLCASRDAFVGGWNFGADASDTKPVGWIADRMVSLWGEDARWTTDASHQPHEAKLLYLDCTKARTELGWRPRLPLGTALEWVVDWYRAFERRDDLRRVTIDQVARYEALAA